MELIFVYNAKSDAMSIMVDYAHKMFSPKTYSCDLCMLTHTNFGERKAWKTFTKKTNAKLSFYHIEDFEQTFDTTHKYPVVLKKTGDKLSILLSAEAISAVKNIDNLIQVISEVAEN